MAWRLTELVPVREQSFDEPFNTPIAIVSFLPIEYRQHRRNGDRIDRLTFWDQGRIFFVRELAERVVVGERLRKRDRHEVQARVRRDFGKEIDRPSDHPHQSSKLAALELL